VLIIVGLHLLNVGHFDISCFDLYNCRKIVMNNQFLGPAFESIFSSSFPIYLKRMAV